MGLGLLIPPWSLNISLQLHAAAWQSPHQAQDSPHHIQLQCVANVTTASGEIFRLPALSALPQPAPMAWRLVTNKKRTEWHSWNQFSIAPCYYSQLSGYLILDAARRLPKSSGTKTVSSVFRTPYMRLSMLALRSMRKYSFDIHDCATMSALSSHNHEASLAPVHAK